MIKTNDNTHLNLGNSKEDGIPITIPFNQNKNIEIVGLSGSGKTNLTSSIALQIVNIGKPKKMFILSDWMEDYYAFVKKGAIHTSSVDDYVNHINLACEEALNGNTESVLIIENLDNLIKGTDAKAITSLLKSIEEEGVTLIVTSQQKSLLSGLFNIKFSQIKGLRYGNFNVSIDKNEKDCFNIKAHYVNINDEHIKPLVKI